MASTTYNGFINYQAYFPTSGYVLFSSPNNSISLQTSDGKGWWTKTMQTSTDNITWTTWDGTTTISSTTGKIYVRGLNNTYVTALAVNSSWVLTGTDISISGNIEALLDYRVSVTGKTVDNVLSTAFARIFINNVNIIDASELKMPRMTLVKQIYYKMFEGCSSLVNAPALPATTLAEDCYADMFYGCSSLIATPALPATTLANRCYAEMFRGCTNLTTISALPATSLATECYRGMFEGCTSLATLPALPATILPAWCYASMFRNCTNIKIALTTDDVYVNSYRIPTKGTGTASSGALDGIFAGTGGKWKAAPDLNKTHFTPNDIIR